MSIRMRHTKGHTGNRRSHHALSDINIIKDKESGKSRLPHHLDESTGIYRGVQIFTPKVKKVVEDLKQSINKGSDNDVVEKKDHSVSEIKNEDHVVSESKHKATDTSPKTRHSTAKTAPEIK